jgi:hypothetical protein
LVQQPLIVQQPPAARAPYAPRRSPCCLGHLERMPPMHPTCSLLCTGPGAAIKTALKTALPFTQLSASGELGLCARERDTSPLGSLPRLRASPFPSPCLRRAGSTHVTSYPILPFPVTPHSSAPPLFPMRAAVAPTVPRGSEASPASWLCIARAVGATALLGNLGGG